MAERRNWGYALVAAIRIYFEGDRQLRRGFSAFLRAVEPKPRVIPGDSRENALRDFFLALRTHPGTVIFLLIDAERPLEEAWSRLRSSGEWRDSGASEDQAHFMTQCMESWFVADFDALRQYYGQQFNDKSLPQNPDVESVPKEDILTGLASATRNTQKGRYHKTRHAPDILQGLDVTVVRQKAPQCNRLFQKLEELTADNS